MIHVPEIGAINELNFSGVGIWYVCYANLRPRFIWYQTLAPIRTLFCTIPENSVHVTEMKAYDWSMNDICLHFRVLACCNLIANLSSMSLSALFIFGAVNFHSTRIWHKKTSTRKWSRLMALVSRACVIGLTVSILVLPRWCVDILLA